MDWTLEDVIESFVGWYTEHNGLQWDQEAHEIVRKAVAAHDAGVRKKAIYEASELMDDYTLMIELRALADRKELEQSEEA